MKPLQPYKSYKSEKLSWIQTIPSHWNARRAKFLFNLEKRPPRDSDGIVTAFRDGEVTLRSNRRTDGFTNSFKEIGYQGVRKGDLVIHAMDAFAGAIGVSDSDGKSTPVYSCLTARDGAYIPYYAAMLRSMALSGFIQSLAKGIRERSTDFRWGEISELSLPVPPMSEQNLIANYLGRETIRIDTLIAKKTRFIELLKEKRQAVITKAVTKGLDDSVELKDSGAEWIGETPKHWRVTAIKWLTPIRRGASPRPIDDPKYFNSTGKYGWVRISDVTSSNRYLLKTEQKLSELGSSFSVKLPLGSLFLSIAGSVGKPCITGIDACIHDGFVYFPLLRIDPMWLFWVFEAKAPFVGLGKLGTQLNLNTETVGGIRVGLPPEPEMTRILKALDFQTERLERLIEKTERSIELLKEHRAALITAAVTGKIDVREAA